MSNLKLTKMKTRIFLLLCLFLGIGLLTVSAQNGTIFHAYPDRLHDTPGYSWVTCDGVNVDFLEYQMDGMGLTKVREEVTFIKIIDHWTFKSAITGEEFKVIEIAKNDVISDSEGNYLQSEGIWRANFRGDAGSHYQTKIYFKWTAPDNIYFEFLDFRCF
jgi:hypothetical protein